MATQFPTALDDFTNPLGTDQLGSTSVPHATQHSNLNDAVEALEAKVGVDDSAVATSLEYRLGVIEDLGIGNTGYKDLTAPIFAAPGGAAAPTLTNFGAAGTLQRQEYAFAVNDYVWLAPFHVNHDVKVGGFAYVHVHWSTSGTNVQPVHWQLHMQRALGHQQATFAAPVLLATIIGTPSGIALRHMVTEVGEANKITLTEPDELILLTLRRVTNGATENTDSIFGLMVDFHYESNRDTTPLKGPPFYT
jgi:hypothetical protein